MIALLALLSTLQAQAPQGWTETRFHRVQLRNGNFIDGALIRNEPEAVTLRVKTGELEISRDLIHKVEYLTIRSYAEKPTPVPPPAPAPAAEDPAPPVPAPLPDAPSSPVRARIEELLAKARHAPAERKELVLGEITAFGYEGGLVLAALMERLGDDHVRLAGRALRGIRAPGLREPVKALLHSSSALVRAEAVDILAAQGVETDRLADPSPLVRAAALRALEAFRTRSAFERAARLCADADPDVRRHAVRAAFVLAREHELGPALVAALGELLRGPAPNPARVEILDALGRLRHADAWPAVAEELRHEAPEVRAAAARCLGELATADASGAVAEALGGESVSDVKIALARAAGKLKDPELVPSLMERLSDTQPSVIRAAADALCLITGQNHGVDRARWEAYWARVQGR